MLDLLDRLIKSRVDRELDHGSGHLPISTMLDISVKHKDKEPKRNRKKLDDKKLCEVLRQILPQPHRAKTETALDPCTSD